MRTRKQQALQSGANEFKSFPQKKCLLRLYVAGMTARSALAIDSVGRLCEKHLHGCELQVIDIYRQPELARSDRIIATPTLLKKWPLPLRRFIGDMSKTDKILHTLDIRRG